jgi:hypothetical protein
MKPKGNAFIGIGQWIADGKIMFQGKERARHGNEGVNRLYQYLLDGQPPEVCQMQPDKDLFPWRLLKQT